MKSFFKFILIAIAVLIGSIYIFIIVIIVVGYLLLAPPFGCDPYEASEACDYKDKEFEGELEALPSNFIDKILIKKPVFWVGDYHYPKAINFPYVYIKDNYGVWIRYGYAEAHDGTNTDFLLQKEIPNDYYTYDEKDLSPSYDKVEQLKYSKYNIYKYFLSDLQKEIFSQTIHYVIRRDVYKSSDAYSAPGTSFVAPIGADKNIKIIKELQILLKNVKLNLERGRLDHRNGGAYKNLHGDKIMKKLNKNIFEINGQVIRLNLDKSKDIKVICGEDICLAIALLNKPSDCDRTNPTEFYIANMSNKFFSDFIKKPDNLFQYGSMFKEELGDIVSFEIIPTEYKYIGDRRSFSTSIQNKILLKNARGEILNDTSLGCGGSQQYNYAKVKELKN